MTPSWRPVASMPLENRLVSSANSTGMVFLQTVQMPLMLIRKSNIDPCGTPHLIIVGLQLR